LSKEEAPMTRLLESWEQITDFRSLNEFPAFNQ